MDSVSGTIPGAASASASGLPQTIYRTHVENCRHAKNAFTFDFMCDYLTMMDVLAKAIARELDAACQVTPLQYRIMLRLLADDDTGTKQLSCALGAGMSTVSVAVAKLADRGIVLRRDNAADMRAVELRLSRRGRTLVERADEAVFAIMSDYWGSLTQEQFEAAVTSSIAAVERHSFPRLQNGEPRLDTALVDTVMISRMLTSRALHAEGLATVDYRVLLALKVLGGHAASADIARFLFLNPSDITSSLKNLEALRLIVRQRSPQNRRIRVAKLTDAGDERLATLLPVVFDALHETCHSNDELIRIHISAARDLVARKRHRSDF